MLKEILENQKTILNNQERIINKLEYIYSELERGTSVSEDVERRVIDVAKDLREIKE